MKFIYSYIIEGYGNFSTTFYKINEIFRLLFKFVAKRINTRVYFSPSSRFKDSSRIQYRVSARRKKQNGISSTLSARIFRYFEQYSTTRSNEVKSVEVVSGTGEDAIFYEYWKVSTEKYHSIFNVSRIHRKLNNVLRNLFVPERSLPSIFCPQFSLIFFIAYNLRNHAQFFFFYFPQI